VSIPEAVRVDVRRRAGFACEFCGVTETDSGGELTIDHFRPRAKGGSDAPENLLYSCARCNQYKADYWPAGADEPLLWNPRVEPMDRHLLALGDGTLYPLTTTGSFTLRRLRLNRPPLVADRLRRRYEAEAQRLLTRYRDVVELLEVLHEQQLALMEEQRELLEEQRWLLRILTRQRG
jgi:hypothetical protein